MAYVPKRARILAACGVLLLCDAMAWKNWPKAKDGRICSSLTPAYLSQSCAVRFGANSTNKLKP